MVKIGLLVVGAAGGYILRVVEERTSLVAKAKARAEDIYEDVKARVKGEGDGTGSDS